MGSPCTKTINMATPNPNLSSFIWSVADLLRGDYKPSDYGKSSATPVLACTSSRVMPSASSMSFMQ